MKNEAYTYRIDFANGDYYYGWHKIDGEPESDGYYGSPKTNKHRWDEDIFCKTVIALHATKAIALEHESELIGDNYRNDTHCLNAHNNKNFLFFGEDSEQTRIKKSLATKAYWKDVDNRKHHSNKMKRYYKNPESRQKASQASKKAMTSELKSQISDSCKKTWDEDRRIFQSEIAKSTHLKHGDNMHSSKRNEYRIQYDDGTSQIIKGLREFCRDNNHSRHHLTRLRNRKIKSYKNITSVELIVKGRNCQTQHNENK